MGPKRIKTGGINEPLNNYVVDVVNKEGHTVSFKVLAHTSEHARQKIYAKLCHLQDDLSKYSMGRSALIHDNWIN